MFVGPQQGMPRSPPRFYHLPHAQWGTLCRPRQQTTTLYLAIPIGAMTAEPEELQANNVTDHSAWATYKLVLAITHNQFVAAIDGIY